MSVLATMTINGKPVSAAEWVDVINPARTSEVVGRYPNGTAADADAAVAAASEAFPGWRRTPVAERAALLAQAGQLLTERAGDWASTLTRENGKVLAQANLDIYIAGAVFDYYSKHPEFVDDRVSEDGRGRLIIRHDPLGVCVGIIPWNYPVILAAMKLGPALLAGNTAVIKGPEVGPLAMMLALEAVAEVLPPGVLNVVSGTGAEVGSALVKHPLVRKIAFTGGTEVGKIVMADAATNLSRVTLELGGNDAAVLLDDVDLSDQTIERIATGAFTNAGQICYAIKRLLVPRSKVDEVVDKLSALLDTFVVGDGLDPAVTMGPVNNDRQYAFVRDLLERTRRQGYQVRELGSYADGTDPESGYFIRPHLVLGAPDSAAVVSCEQFGPVLPVLPYDDEDEAIARANNTDLGLASSVWTTDPERGWRVASQLEAGSTFINGHSLYTLDVEAPFGGFKQSGIGRELGPEGVKEYVQVHTITNRHA